MNEKGSLWGIGLIIVLVALGIWWLSNNQAAPTDALADLLNGLKEETELAFTEVQPVDFDWMYEGADKTSEKMAVSGKGFEVTEISSDQQQEISDYFEAQGFAADAQNVAAGTIASMTGYKKNDIVVLIESGVTGGEEGMEAENVTYDVKVKVAQAEVPTVKTDTELIAEAFAKKYNNVSADDITVTISKQIKTFATGGVKLSSDPEAAGGLFFAIEQDGEWLIAWDGNGTIGCASIDKYDFPTEIISECVDEQGNLKTR